MGHLAILFYTWSAPPPPPHKDVPCAKKRRIYLKQDTGTRKRKEKKGKFVKKVSLFLKKIGFIYIKPFQNFQNYLFKRW